MLELQLWILCKECELSAVWALQTRLSCVRGRRKARGGEGGGGGLGVQKLACLLSDFYQAICSTQSRAQQTEIIMFMACRLF